MNNRHNIFLKTWNCTVCRIGIILFTTILILLFLLSALANPILNWIIKPQILHSINNSNTNLKIDAVDFSLFQNKFTAYNIDLVIKDSTDLSKDFNRITIPYFSINRINWFTFLFGNGYKLGDIIIDSPKIRIKNYKFADSPQENISEKDTSDFSDSTLSHQLARLIPDKLNPLNINSLKINSANIIRIFQPAEGEENKTIDSVKNLTLILTDIYLNKNADYKIGENSVISNYEINIKGFHKKYFGPGYDFKISSIIASGSKSNLEITGLSYHPFISDEEFFKGDKYRRDRWIVKIPEVTAYQIDLIKFLNENLISAGSLNIPNFRIEIFTNRRLPIDPASNPEMPHEILSSLNFGLEIEEFQTDSSLIILESVMPNVARRAHLDFQNVNALIHNISNTERKQTKENPCVITASAYVQGKGKINAKLNYPLLSEQFNFNYKGSFGEMDAKLFNSQLEVEDKTHIESGKIVQATLSSEVRNGISYLNIIPIYNNLEIKILDEESTETRGLATLLMDVQIRESNPDEEGKIKSANINYIKKPGDAFMDVVWLAILKGLGEVVGF